MEKLSLRKAYGESLVALGREHREIVALEADLGKSTMSILFKEKFPERYFEMGIAEANMASVSAGLALAGKIPFYSTFAVFASGRAYDQIRCSIAIPRANVRICGSSCGLSDFGDGKTHQSVEDASVLMAMPHMTVLNPCDAVELTKMMKALVSFQGPAYLRVSRNDLPVYTPADGDYQIGKIYPLTGSADTVIFATGVEVSQAMEAAALLKADGIEAQVLNVSSLKPLPRDEVLKYACGKKAVVTAEEGVLSGGLGSAVGAILAEAGAGVPFARVGINDEFGTSAHSYGELLERYGLTAGHIASAVKKVLK